MGQRRDRIRDAVQQTAKEQGHDLSEDQEHRAVEMVDSVIPEGCVVLTEEEAQDLFGDDLPPSTATVDLLDFLDPGS